MAAVEVLDEREEHDYLRSGLAGCCLVWDGISYGQKQRRNIAQIMGVCQRNH
jgi:hypothetical protein